MAHAYAQYRSNKGAPGVDRQDLVEVEAYEVVKWLIALATSTNRAMSFSNPLVIAPFSDH